MDIKIENTWKVLLLTLLFVSKHVFGATKSKKEAKQNKDDDKGTSSNTLFQYDCLLPDGRPYKSTIPCPKYTPDGRVVLRAPAGNPNPCANAGRFLNAYCIADYNCNNNQSNNNFNNNYNQAGAENNNQQQFNNTSNQQQQGQVECIRAYCCTRTTTQKDKVNVRNQNDISLCTNGGYSMGNTCSQDSDCNPNDVGRAARGYSLLKCINGNCCSRPYKKPNQNQICLNGGRSTGQDCVVNDDCRGPNVQVNNNQRGGKNRNNNPNKNYNLGGANNGRLECVEHTCCSQPNQRFNSGGDTDENSDDESEDSEEDNVCSNGGLVLRDNGGQIIYCESDRECGGNRITGGSPAICSNGQCCSNTGDLNGGRRRRSDFHRGTAVCGSLAPRPGIYIGKHCRRASDCGYSAYNTYSCAGDYCCEEDYDLANRRSHRDRFCNHQGTYMGNSCLEDRDCALGRDPARAIVCINRSCCSIYIRLGDDDGVNGLNGPEPQFCRGDEYGHYLEETCFTTSDCPVFAGGAGVRIPVRCKEGVCCALGSGRGRYQLNDVGGNVPLVGQQGLTLPRRPAGSVAICYDGSLSAVECQQSSECQAGHSCVNHLCCPKREDERQHVCGGLAANGDCFANGQCSSNLYCTSAKLCCECRYGQPQLGVGLAASLDCRQNAALCKQGYICNSGGFCCPKCPNNEVPFGSCSAGRCGNGYACQPGNICCQSALSYTQALVPSRDRLSYDPYYNQVNRINGFK